MSKKVIFKYNNKIMTLVPFKCGLSIDEIAKKDVPLDTKYKIVDDNFIVDEWNENDYDGVGTAIWKDS